jgi:AcrR family transcriptional regulator
MATLTFKLNENIYLRDPQTSDLGHSIIRESIALIDANGFEQFTFKKLAKSINSTEASVYRYFENKHRLLIYLIDWYWTWLDYRLAFAVQNLTDPKEQLKSSLKILIEEKKFDAQFGLVDEVALQRIVMAEFEKTYLTKQVDHDNKEGLFLPYKEVCKRVAGIVRQINPHYLFANSIVSTLLLTINHQMFYAKHLPSLTDLKPTHHMQDELYTFCESFIFKSIAA